MSLAWPAVIQLLVFIDQCDRLVWVKRELVALLIFSLTCSLSTLAWPAVVQLLVFIYSGIQ